MRRSTREVISHFFFLLSQWIANCPECLACHFIFSSTPTSNFGRLHSWVKIWFLNKNWSFDISCQSEENLKCCTIVSSRYVNLSPESVKYRLFHFLKMLQRPPFFSFNWPWMTGSCSWTKLLARSGWLQRKQPQCLLGPLYSKTSKKRWDLNSCIKLSWA